MMASSRTRQAALVLGLLVSSAQAQERVRFTCDPESPQSKCPGPNCLCIGDTLELTFDGETASNLSVTPSQVKASLEVTVILDTVSSPVQGWSYGVSHEEAILTLTSATTNGTDARNFFQGGFDATSMERIETCTVPQDLKCTQTRPGGGWISAFVLSLLMPVELPLKRSSLARASYLLNELPGQEGTVVAFTDRLKRTGAPPVPINITVSGKSRVPTKVIDGFIVAEPPECPDHAFYFGAGASRASFDLQKGQEFPISMRHRSSVVGFTVAMRTPLERASLWEFSSGSLGQEKGRLLPLEIVEQTGETHVPWTPNRAVSPEQRVIKIERGSAIAPLQGRDFLIYDLSPAVGGPGFILGYITDLAADEKAMIPVSPGEGCVVSEVLRITLGDSEPGFRRGDGDGNGRITILDAILALPVGRRLPAAVDCDDAFDADDDGRQTIRDVIFIIQYVFQGGRVFPPPFPLCGPDPTNDPRECAAFSCL